MGLQIEVQLKQNAMASFTKVITALAVCCLSISFNSASNTHKIVTYWGQNACYASHHERENWEKDLSEFCKNYNYDVIILSFLNVFFHGNNKDRMPGFNFAFHCETPVSKEYPKMFRCPKIEEGIKECQRQGKTVLMSLGGAVGRSGFANDEEGKLLAYRIYHLLLEGTELSEIRPFGTAVLNGVDLDIEGGGYQGYTAFVKELRRLEKTGSEKYMISAAPQCPYPDRLQGPLPGHFLGDVPEMIDEIYVQFYNNWCKISNPRVFFDFLRKWLDYSKKTNGPMVYIGVPAAPRAAGAGYVTPDFLKGIYEKVKDEERLGGIMFWDAGFDQNSHINGKHFSEHVAEFIGKRPKPTVHPVTLPTHKPGPTTKAKPTKHPKTTKHHGDKTTKVKPTSQPYYKDCKGLDDGLYPMRDCRKYIECAEGRTYKHQCPSGLYFNPKIKACDWPEHVDCKMPTWY